jgi:hypothetical protein
MTNKNGTNWWTSDINSIYREKAKCFAQQYSGYKIESTDEYVGHLLLLIFSILFFKIVLFYFGLIYSLTVITL